jgi:hypothetical protein
MALTNAGRDFIAGMIMGVGTAFTNANMKIGVGDTATAFAVTQTDLTAPANKLRKAVDASFPTIAANVITAQATFTSAEANFAWNEWGIFNAAAAGVMLDRVVEYNGTKLAGQTWIFQVQLTVNIGA